MLDCIERISLHYGLGINNPSGKKRHKNNKRITVNSFKFEVKRRYKKLDKELKKKGSKSHLLLFLSGQGGFRKIYVISVYQRYCSVLSVCINAI